MVYYPRIEQETIYNYDPTDKIWRIYSTYPPHIRKILERADIKKMIKDDDGRVIEVDAVAKPSQIRIYK